MDIFDMIALKNKASLGEKANQSDVTEALALKADDSRVDNIVAQAGTDNTEIVDARTSKEGIAYSVLRTRISDIEKEVFQTNRILLTNKIYSLQSAFPRVAGTYTGVTTGSPNAIANNLMSYFELGKMYVMYDYTVTSSTGADGTTIQARSSIKVGSTVYPFYATTKPVVVGQQVRASAIFDVPSEWLSQAIYTPITFTVLNASHTYTVNINAMALVKVDDTNPPSLDSLDNLFKDVPTQTAIYSNQTNSVDAIKVKDKTIEFSKLTDDAVIDITTAVKNDNSKSIIMIGDSIGQRIGNQLTAVSPNSGRTYEMKAIGGETVLDTLAKLGAIPYMVLPCTIPASGATSALTLLSSAFLKTDFDPSTAAPTFSNGYTSNYSASGIYPYGTMKCTIKGIPGTLYFARSYTTDYFIRDTSGAEVVLDRPYPIIPTEAPNRNAAYLCFMGTNGGWDSRFWSKVALGTADYNDADFLVNLYKNISEWIRPSSKDYLFLGFYMTASVDQKTSDGRKDWWDYFEKKMTDTFGYRYLSVRKYLMTKGYVDAGITLTSSDISEILSGQIPYTSCTDDGTHVSTIVAKCIGNQILERLKNLNIVDSYTPIVIS